MVLTVDEDPCIIIKKRHALLRRKGSIDKWWIIVGKIGKHEMLYSIFAMR